MAAVRAIKRASDKGGAESRFSAYNAAVSACEKGTQWVHVLQLFREMADTRVQKNILTYIAEVRA